MASISKKTIQYSDKLLLAFVFLALLGLAVPQIYLVLGIIFPGIFLIKKSSFAQWVAVAPLLFLFNLSVIVLLFVALSILGVNISPTTLSISAAVLSIGSYFAGKRFAFAPPQVPKSHLKFLLAIYGMFSVAVLSRLVSVANLDVPILHDTVSHAYWAKGIVEKGTIDYYYSPALHILTAFTAFFSDMDTPKLVHLITNFFNAAAVLFWGIFIYLATKKPGLAVTSAAITFFASTPLFAYTSAGKNAQVLAIALIPYVVYATTMLMARRKHAPVLFVSALTFLGLTHYPTFGLVLAGVCLAIGIKLVMLAVTNRNYNPLKYLNIILPVVAAVLVIGIWFYFQRGDYSSDTADVLPRAKEKFITGENRVIYALSAVTTNLISGWGSSDVEILRVMSTFRMPLLIVGFLYILFLERFKQNKLEDYKILIGSIVVAVIGISFFIPLLAIGSLHIVMSTGYILVYQLATLVGSYVVWAIGKKLNIDSWRLAILCAILIVLGLFSSFYQAQQFQKVSRQANVVDSNDMDAFNWINENVGNEEGFISNSVKNKERDRIIFASDGAVWIPVFTGNEISTPFHSTKFSDTLTHANYDLYTNIENGTDVKESVQKLNDNGFEYYYYDKKGWLRAPLDVEKFKNGADVKTVYENDGVIIYQITADQ